MKPRDLLLLPLCILCVLLRDGIELLAMLCLRLLQLLAKPYNLSAERISVFLEAVCGAHLLEIQKEKSDAKWSKYQGKYVACIHTPIAQDSRHGESRP